MCKEERETAFKLFLSILLFCSSILLLIASVRLYISYDQSLIESPVYEGSVDMKICVSQEKFSGELYYGTGSDRDGIGFEVVINSTYYTLRVTRLATGMDAINVLHPQSSNMTLTSIKNVTFMIMMNSTSQMNDFIVHRRATGLMKTMMRINNPRMTDHLFTELHRSAIVDEARKISLQYLAASREGCHVIQAAEILAQANKVISMYPPAVRQFYLLGLQLEKMRIDTLGTVTGCRV